MIYNKKSFAKALGVSVETIDRYRKAGKLPHHRIGDRVIFTDGDLKVLHVIENMKPWRLSPIIFKAVYTIELAAGYLKGGVKQGDQLALSDFTA